MTAPLSLRPCLINGEPAPDDFNVIEDGAVIGRIYRTAQHQSETWVWSVTVGLPTTAYGRSQSFVQAKSEFRTAWAAFKAATDPGRLAQALAERAAHADRP